MNLLQRPLYLILLLAGTEPIHEEASRTQGWWYKINKFGIVCSICQTTLTVLGYVKESVRTGATAHFSNNIMRATIINKQLFTLVIPFVYIFTKFYHMHHLEAFHRKTRHFDLLIRSAGSWRHQLLFQGELARIERTTRHWGRFAVVALVLGEVVNICIGALYIYRTTDEPPLAATFYFYQMTVVNFIGAALDIGIRLNGLSRRMQLLLRYEQSILREIVSQGLLLKRTTTLFTPIK